MESYASCTILIYKFLVDINRTPLSLFPPLPLVCERSKWIIARRDSPSTTSLRSLLSLFLRFLVPPSLLSSLSSSFSSFVLLLVRARGFRADDEAAWLSIWCRRCQIVKQLKLPRKVYVRPLPPGLSQRDRIYIEFARTSHTAVRDNCITNYNVNLIITRAYTILTSSLFFFSFSFPLLVG